MTAREFELAGDIFSRAVELAPGPARDEYIGVSCPPALSRFVRELLEADAAAQARPEPSLRLPRCGPYQAESLLGAGGAGLVFLARRADGQFEQTVALKVLRAVSRSEQAQARFRAERQILAQLQHPNIAALYDGGVTAEGEPYLVMEYIDGPQLDTYCDRLGMSVVDRIGLFAAVLDAVDYAHRKFVVHGDLKPSNILVNSHGTLKVVDFGASRLISEQTVSATVASMTPNYASPEQLRGERLTTASDVYSLGMILYELLTGAPPFGDGPSLLSVLERALRRTNPLDPASAVTEEAAHRRSASIADLRRSLRGDLRSILLKALEPDPGLRYAVVSEFAADLDRYRRGLPILARPQTWRYRSARFIGRHRFGAFAAAAVVAVLAVAAWTAVDEARIAAEQRRVAEARLQDLRKLTRSILFDFHDTIQALPGATQARKLLVQRALDFLNSVDAPTAKDPVLQAQLIEAYRKIGDVQGNPSNANLGDTAAALASYAKGLAIAEPLAAAHLDDLAARRALAILLQKMADTQANSGDVKGAVERSRRALGMFTDLAAKDSRLEARQQFGTAHIKLADLLGHPSFPNLGDSQAAMEHYRKAQAIYESLNANDAVTRRYLGLIYERLGKMFELQGSNAEALASYEQSFRMRERLSQDFPLNVNARRDLAIAHEKVGELLVRTGQPRDALPRFRQALAIFESLHAMDPLNANATRALAIEYEKVGRTYDSLARRDIAAPFYAKAVALYQRMAASDPSNASVRSDVERLNTTLRAR